MPRIYTKEGAIGISSGTVTWKTEDPLGKYPGPEEVFYDWVASYEDVPVSASKPDWLVPGVKVQIATGPVWTVLDVFMGSGVYEVHLTPPKGGEYVSWGLANFLGVWTQVLTDRYERDDVV